MEGANPWRVALAALSLSVMLAVARFSGLPLLPAGAQEGVTLELVA